MTAQLIPGSLRRSADAHVCGRCQHDPDQVQHGVRRRRHATASMNQPELMFERAHEFVPLLH